MQSNEQASNPNMDLWGKVFVTDKAHVSEIKGKSYKGNSPRPYYLIQKATETFGPCGIGWGYRIVEQGTQEVRYPEPLGNTGNTVERLMINHWVLVEFWYKLDGVKSEPIQQYGGTKLSYRTSTGKQEFDEDAQKKSVTDALIKCMSCVGFAGDIFSGRWDDSKYHQEQEEKKQQQGQRQQQNAQQRQGQGQQRQGQQQNAQQAQGQQKRPIAQHASQMTPEGQANALRKALNRINNTTDAEDLNASIKFFAGTEHEQTVRNACNAKADREGWVNG